MSIQVANIDFSSAVVGQTGRIVNLQQLLPPPTISQQMRPQDNTAVAHLSIFNESGALLTILLPDTLQTKTLPAGRWLILPIPPNETEVDYQIVALAQGAPFHNLLADYFYPGEAVEALGVVGNSPVGVSGNVSTSGAGGTSFIKNDGAAPATSIAESTPSDQVSSSVSLNNDASGFLQVLSANVLRKILNVVRGNATTGKAAITLGDSGDATITTFYGSLQGGQPATVGAITGAGANSLDGGKITTNGTGGLSLVSSSGFLLFGDSESGSQSQLFYTHANLASVLNSPQAGATALGIAFGVWTGTVQSVPLSLGGQFIGAKSWIDANGVGHIGQQDGAAATVRACQEFLGTPDPATYATVNEGDAWDKI